MKKPPCLLRLLPSNTPGNQVFQGAGFPLPFSCLCRAGAGEIGQYDTRVEFSAGDLQPECGLRCYSMVHMKTMNYVSLMVGAALAVPAVAQDQAVASVPSVPAQAAAASRPAAEVLNDGVKLMQSEAGVLKSVNDAASAANAVAPLQQLKALQEALDGEWDAASEKLSQEELEKLLASVQGMEDLDKALSTEVERLEKVGFFGDDALKGLLIDESPVEVEEDVTVVEEQTPPSQPAAVQPAAPVQSAAVVKPAVAVEAPVQSSENRSVTVVLNDWGKLMADSERLLKSIQDGASASAAVAELGRLRADYERLGKEMQAFGSSALANIAPEEIGAFMNQVNALQKTGASLLSEWKRINDAAYYGNGDLKDVMQNFVPAVQVASPAAATAPARVQ